MSKSLLGRTLLTGALAAALAAASLPLTASPAHARDILRGDLTLDSGENPTVPGTVDPAFVATARGRVTDQGLVRVDMSFIDAARFPAGTLAEVRIGGISASVPLAPFAPEVAGATDNPLSATTMIAFKQPGTASAGDRVEIRIRSEFVVNGVRQRHETRCSGTLVVN